MPQDVTVNFDNGPPITYRNVPDDVTKEAFLQRAQSDPDGQGRNITEIVRGKVAEPSLFERGLATLKATGASVLTGLANTVQSMPAEGLVTDELRQVDAGMRTEALNNTQKFSDKHGLKPGYGKSVAESIGGGIAFGGVSPQALISAAGSGVGSEAAAKLAGDSFWSRLIGGLAGGGLAGGAAHLASRVRPQTAEIARESLAGISLNKLDEATAFMKRAEARGTPVDISQALVAVGVPEGNLTTIRNLLAQRKQGSNIQALMHEQPGKLSIEADQISARLPGRNYGPSQAANNLQEEATALINTAKRQRTQAVREDYAKVGELPPGSREKLSEVVKTFLSRPGVPDKVRAEAAELLKKFNGEAPDTSAAAISAAREALSKATSLSERIAARRALAEANAAATAAAAKPVPSLHALDVDTAISQFVGPFKGTPLNPVDPKTRGLTKELGAKLNATFQDLSPEIKAAEANFARITKDKINPLKQGSVGEFATARGYMDDKNAVRTRFSSLMERGTDPGASNSDILVLGRELAKQSPTTFGDALKTYVSGKISSAMTPGGTAATAANNPDMAAKIASSLWGTVPQAQGLREAVSIAAESVGRTPAVAVRGLNSFMQLVEAQKSRPAAIGGLSLSDITQAGGRNSLSDAARVFSFMPVEKLARRGEELVLGKTLEQFDKILTSKEGLRLLEELGKVPVMSKTAQHIAGQMGAQFGANPGQITEQ